RLAAAAVELTAAAAIGPRGSDLAIRDLRFTPRGAAVTAVHASGRLAAETGGAVQVRDLRLATARTRLDADGQLLPAREVRGRLALVLDAGELRALVPASPRRARRSGSARRASRPRAGRRARGRGPAPRPRRHRFDSGVPPRRPPAPRASGGDRPARARVGRGRGARRRARVRRPDSPRR